MLALLSVPQVSAFYVGSGRTTATRVRCARPISAALDWEDVAGCQLLRPPGEARAVVHFLGGVFVSPQPQVAYRYLLESLAERGYAVVATPYAVAFDYLEVAAVIQQRFAAAKLALPGEYDALPQMAMGHSLGALMQSLLCSLYPDEYAPTCATALVSWNNKPVSDAIPLFQQVFVPALSPLEPLTRQPVFGEAIEQVAQLRTRSFGLARQLNQLNPLGSGASALVDTALRDAEAVASLADQVVAHPGGGGLGCLQLSARSRC